MLHQRRLVRCRMHPKRAASSCSYSVNLAPSGTKGPSVNARYKGQTPSPIMPRGVMWGRRGLRTSWVLVGKNPACGIARIECGLRGISCRFFAALQPQ